MKEKWGNVEGNFGSVVDELIIDKQKKKNGENEDQNEWDECYITNKIHRNVTNGAWYIKL